MILLFFCLRSLYLFFKVLYLVSIFVPLLRYPVVIILLLLQSITLELKFIRNFSVLSFISQNCLIMFFLNVIKLIFQFQILIISFKWYISWFSGFEIFLRG